LKLSESERLPKDSDGPVFAEPWEAQAFAMAVKLNEAGVFGWSEWAETLGAALKAEPQRPYYESWLAALERLVESKGVMTKTERLDRVAAWDLAAKATPHGQPIDLNRG
jgi:nitrile hydratase accessory protein